MSDPAEESIRLVTVTLELPEGLLEAYDALVGKRIYRGPRERAAARTR